MKKKAAFQKIMGAKGAGNGSNSLHRINYYLYSIWYSEPEGIYTSEYPEPSSFNV